MNRERNVCSSRVAALLNIILKSNLTNLEILLKLNLIKKKFNFYLVFPALGSLEGPNMILNILNPENDTYLLHIL